MGSYASKLLSHAEESRKESVETQATKHDSEMCTPTLPDRKLLVDPRSVTAGILRTPIEIDNTPVRVIKGAPSAIPKYLQTRQYLETDMDVVMPPLTPKKHFVAESPDSVKLPEIGKMQNYLNINVAPKEITPIEKERYRMFGLDPRSPATDFDRTPILMPRSLALLKARSQENLSRRGSYETDVYNPRSSYQEISASLNIPEVQLLPDIASEGLKKILYLKNRKELCMSNISQSNSDSSISASEEEITVIKNPKFKNAKDKSLISDELTFHTDKRGDTMHKQDDCKDVIEQDMKAMHIKDDTIKIWHDTLSLEENISGKVEGKENIEEKLSRKKVPREDIIITFDEYIKSTSMPKTTKMENVQKKEDVGEKKKKILKTDVELKSDEKKMFSPDNKYGNEIPKNRTPLGNRSNNDRIQGTATKSPPQLLRNKTVTTKKQQENTPPHKRYTVKARNRIQWDPNSTVVI